MQDMSISKITKRRRRQWRRAWGKAPCGCCGEKSTTWHLWPHGRFAIHGRVNHDSNTAGARARELDRYLWSSTNCCCGLLLFFISFFPSSPYLFHLPLSLSDSLYLRVRIDSTKCYGHSTRRINLVPGKCKLYALPTKSTNPLLLPPAHILITLTLSHSSPPFRVFWMKQRRLVMHHELC